MSTAIGAGERVYRCTNCAEAAQDIDDNTLDHGSLTAPMFEAVPTGRVIEFDRRYANGFCGHCRLRGRVPLMLGTYAEVKALIDEREDKELRKRQLVMLRSGALPDHPYRKTEGEACCKEPYKEHVTKARLEQLWSILRG